MSAAKHPAFFFYPGDWQRNPNLRMCSAAARGLFVELLCIMHYADPKGYLVIRSRMTATQLHPAVDTHTEDARRLDALVNWEAAAGMLPDGVRPLAAAELAHLTGLTLASVVEGLIELEDRGVIRRTPEGIIYSDRMIRAAAEHENRIAIGKRGGNPALVGGRTEPARERDASGSPRVNRRAAAEVNLAPGPNVGQVVNSYSSSPALANPDPSSTCTDATVSGELQGAGDEDNRARESPPPSVSERDKTVAITRRRPTHSKVDRDLLFSAIVEVTGVNPTVKSIAAKIGKTVTDLLEATPPVTPAQVLALTDFWTARMSWTGRPRPNVSEVAKHIHEISNPKEATNAPNAGKDGGGRYRVGLASQLLDESPEARLYAEAARASGGDDPPIIGPDA